MQESHFLVHPVPPVAPISANAVHNVLCPGDNGQLIFALPEFVIYDTPVLLSLTADLWFRLPHKTHTLSVSYRYFSTLLFFPPRDIHEAVPDQYKTISLYFLFHISQIRDSSF